MDKNNQAWNAWAMDEILWWSCESGKTEGPIQCSRALQSLFAHPVNTIKDLTGDYDSAIIDIKVQTLLAAPDEDVRFVCSFDTRHGKGSFQHRLRLRQDHDRVTVFAECIDVTEMVLLEEEIVEAQGRLSLEQVYERQELLEEQNRLIQESYRKQSRFLALLSHELRSPLLGINSMVNRLKQRYAQDRFLAERLRIINLTSEQMTFLVNDILTYSQTEYDVIALHPGRFSLNQVFEYVKQLTKSIAADKGVFVSLVYLGERDWVYGDSTRLSQILINLIVNGIKFTRFGGVSVEVTQEKDDFFRFMVMDSGEGIAPDKLAHIFDPFIQFKTEGSTQALGSGLGLSVVKRLIDVMKGEINVTSTLGVGTTFYFKLRLPEAAKNEADNGTLEQAAEENDEPVMPVVATNPANNLMGPSAALKLQHHAQRVLVVDDSKINRMVLIGFLKELSCQVKEAADGQEAWSLVQQEPFDFIFLDIQMPQMDGFEVMEHIRDLRQSGGLSQLKAVFAVTAGGGEELIPKGETRETLGFSKWLVKPITQNQILDIMSEAEVCLVTEDEVEKPREEKRDVEESVDDLEADLVNIPSEFSHMMAAFIDEFESNVKKLHGLVEEAQWHEVKALAHYMKGNCMVFQLSRWVEHLREIESEAQKDLSDKKLKGLLELRVKTLELALKHLENFQVISDNSTH